MPEHDGVPASAIEQLAGAVVVHLVLVVGDVHVLDVEVEGALQLHGPAALVLVDRLDEEHEHGELALCIPLAAPSRRGDAEAPVGHGVLLRLPVLGAEGRRSQSTAEDERPAAPGH